MEQVGYIKLYRSLLNWEWYNDVNTFRLFVHLILTANFTAAKWRGIEVKRGQRITSINKLSLELGLSIQAIRTSIKRLKSTNELTSQTTSEYTVITVNNYEKYQDLTNELTNEQQTNNKPITNEQQLYKKDKKNKNDKNDKKENIYVPFDEIISYLNLKVGSKYKVVESTKKLILVRWNEKFTLDDFKTVIDKKTVEWLNDKKMCIYLRPETLFSNKFEGYLNQQVAISKTDNIFLDMLQQGANQ